MALQQEMSDFLRDAQYRFAELTVNKDTREDDGDIAIRDNISVRRQLDAFLFLLYTNRYDIITPEQGDWPNFLYEKWTDDEIIAEMDYLRELSEMNLIPWLDFTGSVNVVRQEVTEVVVQEVDGIRQSSPGQFAKFVNEFEVEGVDPEDALVYPIKTDAEWTIENPTLAEGYIVFIRDDVSGKVNGFKVGPGAYNELTNVLGESEYVGTETTTTTTVGGLNEGTDLTNLTVNQILEQVLTPYVIPVVSNVQTDAGVSGNDVIVELGTTLNTIAVSYNITAPENLVDTTPINITTNGGFTSNEGDFNNNGGELLTFTVPFQPTVITDLRVDIVATHDTGSTTAVSAYVRFYPKVISGTSQTATITATQVLTLGDKVETITNDATGDYVFARAGYHWICIPAMINPANIVFLDKSQGISVPMTNVDTLSVTTNGISYPFILYRTTYYQNEAFDITVLDL